MARASAPWSQYDGTELPCASISDGISGAVQHVICQADFSTPTRTYSYSERRYYALNIEESAALRAVEVEETPFGIPHGCTIYRALQHFDITHT